MASQLTDISPGRCSRSSISGQEARSPGSSDYLQIVIVGLLSVLVFILPTDLRIFGEKSLALPVGWLCVALGVLGVLKRRTIVAPSSGLLCLLAFLAWSTCSIAWAQYPSLAVVKVLQYWKLFPLAWVLQEYARDRHDRMRLFDAYLAGCWFGVLGVFIRYAAGIQYTFSQDSELAGRYSFGTDPNYLALALVIGVPIAFFRASSHGTRWSRFLFLFYVPAAIAAVVLTGSRGAILALLGAGVVYAICTTPRMRIGLLFGAAICVVLALALPPDFTSRIATIPEELSHGTLSDRRDLWERGTAIVAQHPLRGIGAGATDGAFFVAAHNTPLELMMEGGLAGLVLFYGAFLYSTFGLWRARSQERYALGAVCAAWLVGTCSLSWEVNTVTWFILAMLFSAAPGRKASRTSTGTVGAQESFSCA